MTPNDKHLESLLEFSLTYDYEAIVFKNPQTIVMHGLLLNHVVERILMKSDMSSNACYDTSVKKPQKLPNINIIVG